MIASMGADRRSHPTTFPRPASQDASPTTTYCRMTRFPRLSDIVSGRAASRMVHFSLASNPFAMLGVSLRSTRKQITNASVGTVAKLSLTNPRRIFSD